MTRICTIPASLLLAGCYNYDVDTLEKHCERMALEQQGRDVLELHAPFWAVFPSITFHPDAIRDDFVLQMNNVHLEKIQNRAQRMARREGYEFHLTNVSSLLELNPEEIIEGWKANMQKAKDQTLSDPNEKCLFETAANYFDVMKIHSMKPDMFGRNGTDHVTEIPTDRQVRFKKYGLTPP